MNTVSVEELTSDESGWVFKVTVSGEGSDTVHTVSLTQELFSDLSRGRTPEELVTDSFSFLLERESRDAVLSSFDLSDISTYFPEFGEEIRESRSRSGERNSSSSEDAKGQGHSSRGSSAEQGRAVIWLIVIVVIIFLGVLALGLGFYWHELVQIFG